MAKRPSTAKPDEIDTLILGLIEDAEDFSDAELSSYRAKTWKFYNGKVDTPSRVGRSSVVKTEVRDTVELLMPSIISMFINADNIVEFTAGRRKGKRKAPAPTPAPLALPPGAGPAPPGAGPMPAGGPPDAGAMPPGLLSPIEPTEPDPNAELIVQAAEATEDVNDIFWNDNNGWTLLHDVCKEVLVARSAVLKVYTEMVDEYDEEPIDPFDDMAEEIAKLGGAEIIDPSNTGVDSENASENDPLYSEGTKIARFKRTRKKICVETVPSEELIIDRRCRDHGDGAAIIGQRTTIRLGDLLQMGFPKDMVEEFGETTEDVPDAEERARTGYNSSSGGKSLPQTEKQWALREVVLKEVYPLLDIDGNGHLKRYQCFVVNEKVLRRTAKETQPYIVFSAIRIPHTSIGRSPGEHSVEFQEEGTQVLRQAHDNLLWSNNPGLAVIRNAANPYQVENWGFGQIIDVKMPGAVTPIEIPFVGDKAIMFLEYMEKQREARTGGYRDAMGLNPEKLRGQTATAAEGALSQSTRQIGMYSRVIAETGFVPLFKKIYFHHYGKECALNMRVNVGLGNGTTQERMLLLSAIAAKQEQIILNMGPDNPLCSVDQYAYTLQQLVKLGPYFDPDSMFNDPEKIKQLMAMRAANPQPPPPDPKMIEAQAKASAQQQKTQGDLAAAQARAQADIQATQAKLQADIQKSQVETQGKLTTLQQKTAADIQLNREKAAAQHELNKIELAAETKLEAANVALQNRAGQGNIPKGKQRTKK